MARLAGVGQTGERRQGRELDRTNRHGVLLAHSTTATPNKRQKQQRCCLSPTLTSSMVFTGTPSMRVVRTLWCCSAIDVRLQEQRSGGGGGGVRAGSRGRAGAAAAAPKAQQQQPLATSSAQQLAGRHPHPTLHAGERCAPR